MHGEIVSVKIDPQVVYVVLQTLNPSVQTAVHSIVGIPPSVGHPLEQVLHPPEKQLVAPKPLQVAAGPERQSSHVPPPGPPCPEIRMARAPNVQGTINLSDLILQSPSSVDLLDTYTA